MKRTYTIIIHRDPSISGYGGFDEWTLGPLDNTQADLFLTRLDVLVKKSVKEFKVEGGYTGQA